MNYKFLKYSRYYVCNYGFRNDIYDKEIMYDIHTYLMNDKTNNKISMSIYKRSILKHIQNYCVHYYPNINMNYFIHKKEIKETLNLNKNTNDYVDYMYKEENI